MRSIWRGAVSFGLVSIGVKLYSATEDKDIRFHQVHATDGGRVKYKRVCSVDGEEVEYSDIAKGYELPDGQVVILTDEDFEDLPLSTRREIEVLEFVDQDEIDPIMFEKTYYLEPDGAAARPYVLLRDALENAGQVAITKIAIRQRESLAVLRVRDGVLVMHTMRWPDEIRRPEFAFLDEDISVRPQELKMAGGKESSSASTSSLANRMISRTSASPTTFTPARCCAWRMMILPTPTAPAFRTASRSSAYAFSPPLLGTRK